MRPNVGHPARPEAQCPEAATWRRLEARLGDPLGAEARPSWAGHRPLAARLAGAPLAAHLDAAFLIHLRTYHAVPAKPLLVVDD